jgi:FO synthase
MRALKEMHDASSSRLDDLDRPARAALETALAGEAIDRAAAARLIELPRSHLPALFAAAAAVRTARKGHTVTFSPKVFLPVTNLCLDRCAYCTFRKDPDEPEAWTMLPEEVRDFSRRGRRLGCIEALMCLGDKPERAYRSYRSTLEVLGCRTTVEYVEACCALALEEGLLPHTNAGLLSREEMIRLKPLNASLGLMLESVSPRLRRRGAAHHQAPDKEPALRLAMMRAAGELQIPFTTGILLGIGETPAERVESLAAIGELHAAHGHIQEIIIQNFRAKPSTRMAGEPEPESWDVARTVAVARLMLPDMNLQVPPNLNPYDLRLFLSAGVNDWGGISPLTLDYVNPEAPWPQIEVLERTCRGEGFALAPRLPVYGEYVERPGFLEPGLAGRIGAERARLAEWPASRDPIPERRMIPSPAQRGRVRKGV